MQGVGGWSTDTHFCVFSGCGVEIDLSLLWLSPQGNPEKGDGSTSLVRYPGTGIAEGKVAKLTFLVLDTSYIGKLMAFEGNLYVPPFVETCIPVSNVGAGRLGEEEAFLNIIFSNYII